MGKEPVFILFSKDHFKYSSKESATSIRFEKQNIVRNFSFFHFCVEVSSELQGEFAQYF
jgi:hypothetical protein